MKFLDDSAWFCMEKLKKHGFETNKFEDWPKIKKNTATNPTKYIKIQAS